MNREMIINVAPHEKRIAVLEDKRLAEIIVERPDETRTVGNIYKGKVANVLPGLQSAFIDIGLEKAAFLSMSDIKADAERLQAECIEPEEGVEGQENKKNEKRPLRIENLFKIGQETMLQVLKEPLQAKGARVTSTISIAGRFLVLLPGNDFIGVSKKLRNPAERRRLRKLVSTLRPAGLGFIVRTAGFTKSDQEFKAEISDLVEKWDNIKKLADKNKAPFLLHEEVDASSAAIRDLFSHEVSRLIVDSRQEYYDIVNYLKDRNPELLERVVFFAEDAPIFEVFGIEKELEKSLRRKVWLKSGGYLIFDYTEAMTVIDVNTGRHTGRRNAEETIFKTNREAAQEIARQLRLRDIGGVIAIDFIDMMVGDHNRQLLDEFLEYLKKDSTPFNLGKMSDFGIVLLTRKRDNKSLIASMNVLCEGCGGTGRIFSQSTVLAKIDRLMRKIKTVLKIDHVVLTANPVFNQFLLEENKKLYKEIQKAAHIRITLEDNRHFAADYFEIHDCAKKEDLTKLLTGNP